MKVVVCTKQTPSTTAAITLNSDGSVSWEDAGGKPNILNPWDEYGVETGIRLKEDGKASDVIALTTGAPDDTVGLKTALAMGCTEAIIVADEAYAGVDTLGTARIMAAAINTIGDVSLAIFGRQINGDMGHTAVQTAVKLGWTPLTQVTAINAIDDDKIIVERAVDDGRETVEAPLPVVLSVSKEIYEPRYPSFMGIRKANRVKIPVWGNDELNLDDAGGSKVDWSDIYDIPAREGTVQMIDSDDMADAAEELVDSLFEEKVI